MITKLICKSETNKQSGSWKNCEHEMFVRGLKEVGKNWKKLGDFVPSRSHTQIRSHAQKYFDKLEAKFQSIERLGAEYEKIKGPMQGADLEEYRLFVELKRPKRKVLALDFTQQSSQPMISNDITNFTDETRQVTLDESRYLGPYSPKPKPRACSYLSELLENSGVDLSKPSGALFFKTLVERPTSSESKSGSLFRLDDREMKQGFTRIPNPNIQIMI